MNATTLARTCAPATREEAADRIVKAAEVLRDYGASSFTVRQLLEQYMADWEKERGR